MQSPGLVLRKRQISEEGPWSSRTDSENGSNHERRKRIVSECMSTPFMNSIDCFSPKSPRLKYFQLIRYIELTEEPEPLCLVPLNKDPYTNGQ